MSTLRHRVCHLCEATCGLLVEVDGDEILGIRGDPADPLSRGYMCPKGAALADLHTDPDWLRQPMRRTGTGWEPLSWPAALDFAAEGLRAVQQAHGRNAVAVYQGNPTIHNLGAMLFAPPMVRALRTRSRFSATSVDQLPHHVAAWALYGHQLLLPVPDIDRTELLVLFGNNPLASNGSLMAVPDIRRRLRDLRARGGQLVVFDPRRTETAASADAHHFVRPGTDALVLAAMLGVLFEEGLVDAGPLAPLLTGLDTLEACFAPFSPARVAALTGVPAEVVRDLARKLATSDKAVVHGRMGVSTQSFGGICQWMCQLLNILTGHLDQPGGAMFASPALPILDRASPGHLGAWSTRVRGLPEFAGELPVSALWEEMTTPGEGQIRGLLTSHGNPVLSTPSGDRLDAALDGLDFMVSIDPYINETTRHAHVVLPPASPLTRSHYDAVFNVLAVRNTARFSPPLFPRPPDARHDWEIMAGLQERLGGRMRDRLELAVRRWLGPRGVLALGLRGGPQGSWWPWRKGLTLAQLEAEPSGVDLGPLESRLPGLLFERDTIPLAPDFYTADLARLEAALLEVPPSLVLIGRRDLRSNNSWMHNSRRLVKGKPRCTLLVHPEDAAQSGLADGSMAEFIGRHGTVTVPVSVSDSVMQGVVCLPHGWGHGRQGVRLSVAGAHAGVSANALTDADQVDVVTGNAVLNGVPVELRAVAAEAS